LSSSCIVLWSVHVCLWSDGGDGEEKKEREKQSRENKR
jgi:hypothetical protein